MINGALYDYIDTYFTAAEAFGKNMMTDTLYKIAESWTICNSCLNDTEDLLSWIRKRNETVAVAIRKNRLSDSEFWAYDSEKGTIHNRNNSFFSISGFRRQMPDGTVVEQPILLQPELGFLGIICKEFDGVMHFLMQAKIEPGNVNKIQISPTIQATKSNFTQKHGGARPPYLEYFENASRYEIVVDQIQSEQSSRFYRKRNRNILIRVEEDIPVLPSHRWMTLGQIKRLMREENLVNMDTRTVLSCIPFCRCRMDAEAAKKLREKFSDKTLFLSAFQGTEDQPLTDIWHYMNNCKMFTEGQPEFLPLEELEGWEMKDDMIVCRRPYPFRVVYCDVTMEGREVKHWTQPLFEACGIALFGLICCEDRDCMKFLVRVTPEAGCFDIAELGPTFQKEAVSLYGERKPDSVETFFTEHLQKKQGVFFDQLLSEEGGRFYHEQNRNVLMKVRKEELPELPEEYFLLDYKTLNELAQINNILNIQLRNLLSLLEA